MSPASTDEIEAAPDLIGQRLGKYEVVGLLGRGGMGSVYEALHTGIRKRVALKVIDHALQDNEEAYERFRREALAASAVESPHIVQIFDSGHTEEDTPYLVMEMLRGSDLGAHLKRHGVLDVVDMLELALQVLKGLGHAHAAGIIHRDLKPDNVFLVQRDDEPVVVKLLDFGVSKIARDDGVPLATLTRQGTVVGTPFYMSPEQAQAFPDVDEKADLYSVGAMLYECLTGSPPHSGRSYEQVIVNICVKDVDDVRKHNAAVPEAIAAIIGRALSREREERYESAAAMAAALAEHLPEGLRTSHPSLTSPRPRRSALSSGALPALMTGSSMPRHATPHELAETVHDRPTGRPSASPTPLATSGMGPKSLRPSQPAGAPQRARKFALLAATLAGVALLAYLAGTATTVGEEPHRAHSGPLLLPDENLPAPPEGSASSSVSLAAPQPASVDAATAKPSADAPSQANLPSAPSASSASSAKRAPTASLRAPRPAQPRPAQPRSAQPRPAHTRKPAHGAPGKPKKPPTLHLQTE